MTYDLIGDVHGQFLKLKNVLEHLGYEKKKGVYSKKNHCAIFIGDLVDRGAKTKEVVSLVKNMVEDNHAEAIMGNHEYNLFGFLTKNKKGDYLRDHSSKNIGQVEATLDSYKGENALLQEHLEWLSNLPLYINKKKFRAVHACWDDASVEFIKKSVGRKMNASILCDSYKSESDLENAVKMLTSGPELNLPKKILQKDQDGNFRKDFRYKWWINATDKTYRDLAIKDINSLPDEKILLPKKFVDRSYNAKRKPLFFGHYSMKGLPKLMEANICCLDWLNNKENRIAVYRLQNDEKLKLKNFKCFF